MVGKPQTTGPSQPARELGERLSSERRRRRMSLEQVSAALNIPLRQLTAIEEGDFSVFSAEIYARGVCMTYTKYLGITGDEQERLIWRALSVGRQQVPLKIHTTFSFFERLWNARLMVWVIVGVAALIVGGYIIWQIRSFWQLPALTLTSDIPAIQTDEVLVVKGVTDPEVRLSVNDEAIILHSDASFEVPIRLHPGITIIRIEARNAAGRVNVIEKRVLLPRD